MKRIIALTIVLAVFAVGFANPTMRVRKLELATKLVIYKEGKDPMSFTTKESIKEFSQLFSIDVNSTRQTAGTPPYRIEFWRSTSDKKPFEQIWIDRHGSWGFVKLRPIYGQNKKIVEWVDKLFKE